MPTYGEINELPAIVQALAKEVKELKEKLQLVETKLEPKTLMRTVEREQKKRVYFL